jgi:hypothetical protein
MEVLNVNRPLKKAHLLRCEDLTELQVVRSFYCRFGKKPSIFLNF